VPTLLELDEVVSPPPITLAMLLSGAQTVSVLVLTTIVITAPSPLLAMASLEVQVMVVIPVHVQPVPVAETSVAPAGSGSVTVPEVGERPPLWTVRVYVMVPPRATVAVPVFASVRSGVCEMTQPVTVVPTVLEFALDVSPPPTTLATLLMSVQTLLLVFVTT